jgi:non-specific serine/threonine protein kinase
LRNELSRLRKALGGDPKYLKTSRDTISLDPDYISIDLVEYRQKLRTFEPKSAGSAQIAQQVLSLLTDPLLNGNQEEWLRLENEKRSLLLNDWSAALAVAACLEEDNPLADTFVRDALTVNPINEWVVKIAMERAIRLGRRAEAARLYKDLYQTMSRQFGIIPVPELRAIAQQLLETEEGPSSRRNVPPTNLQRPLQPLVGRIEEIEKLVDLLSPSNQNHSRLVTIRGLGGMGKTRLAIEVANRLKDDYDGHVWFIDVTEIRESSMLVDAIIDQLGIERHNYADRSKLVSSILQETPGLFVIDNFEQVDSGGYELIQSLVQQNHLLKVIVTSRRRIGLSGEYDFPIASLSNMESLELYFQSAPNAIPSEELDRLIELLEGIPLAINLAASYGRVLSPKESLDQIETRFSFLVDPTETQPIRHQRLWDTMEWSYQLLATEVQEAFVGLTVFRGGWTADAASEVLGITEPHRILEKLVSSSLVTARQTILGVRFGFLETLREFGAAKLDPERRIQLLARHFDFYMQFAEARCHSSNVRDYHDSSRFLHLDSDNIRQSFQWSLENHPSASVRLVHLLSGYWQARGHQVEGLTWMRQALVPPYDISEDMIGALHGAGLMALTLNLISDARTYFEASAQIGREMGDEVLEHIVLGRLAEVKRHEGNYKESLELCYKCLDYFAAPEGAYHRSYIYPDLSISLCASNRLDEALDAAEECLASRIQTRHSPLIAESFLLKAQVLVERGESAKANASFALAFEKLATENFPFIYCRLVERWSSFCLDEGDVLEASTRIEELEDQLTSLGSEDDLDRVAILKSRLKVATKNGSDSIQILISAIHCARNRTTPQILNLLDTLAFVLSDIGKKTEAETIRADCDRLRRNLVVYRFPSEERRMSKINPGTPSPKLFSPIECLIYWAAMTPLQPPDER